ncbi:MAG: class II aldolase/adducin family protein [Fimbriimonadaceae bacterium]|nr:class II aldolase/adducin family protein [Fimbriimonadaceae bacterium]
MESELKLRASLCDAGRRLWTRGLIAGGEGNLSVRLSPQRILTTPAGRPKDRLKPADLVVIDLQGLPSGEGRPSSEIRIHLAAYRARPDCRAFIHAHPPCATAFGIAGEPIPHDLLVEAAFALGPVPVVPFGFPGTDELPAALEPYLEDHKTFLLANHGAAVMGASVTDALMRMESLEQIAKTLLYARLLGGGHSMPESALRRLPLSGALEALA